MPLVATKGAASVQGFGEFAQAAAPVYIENVFSTYLYTGNFNYLTITNGIDLLNKGGMVWTKSRTNSATTAKNNHFVIDSARGWASNSGKYINTNTTSAESATEVSFIDPLATGYKLGQATYGNDSALTYVSWTFRKQPKFFDIVTYTGDGTTKAINHNLGSTPGCIIVKNTGTPDDWFVYHRSLNNNSGNPYFLKLNTRTAQDTGGGAFGTPTSTTFTVRNGTTNTNANTYVAYLFAHDAGGFGLTGSDNVITCGSYVGNGTSTGPTVTLGYEPQWVMVKLASGAGEDWTISDTMRQSNVGSDVAALIANDSSAENTAAGLGKIITTSTGFYPGTTNSAFNTNGATYVYIAIRRGPMKTPTSGTTVFTPSAVSVASGTQINAGFAVDVAIAKWRTGSSGPSVFDRLRGISTISSNTGSENELVTSSTAAESIQTGLWTYGWNNTGFLMNGGYANASDIFYSFRRAPGFFDVVCYTGNGAIRTLTHNLGAVPELIIVKDRSQALDWAVYAAPMGNDKRLLLNTTAIMSTVSWWDNTTPTSTTFKVSSASLVNGSGDTFVAYLFGSLPGISKVGSYSGTGTTQQIDCGFTNGARLVLIKRTDSTGNWYLWDSARGIVAGNDPYLLLNDSAAEVTNTDYIDTYSSGFEISSTAIGQVNGAGGTFIFLAIA